MLRYRKELEDLIARVSHPNIGFIIGDQGPGWYIQPFSKRLCTKTDKEETQPGRKWYISMHMTNDEVFRTCLLACEIFERHELYENFKVDGKLYLDPHPEGPRPT